MPAPPTQNSLAAMKCLAHSRVLAQKRFAVAVHADGTGKSNSVAVGATGAFLPQGTTASYAAEVVLRAGGIALNYYELNTERAIRQFGGDKMSAHLVAKQIKNIPDYIIYTSFNALDFLGGPQADLRLSGIGPQFAVTGAQLEVMAEVYNPGDRTILAMSNVSRRVIYREAGISSGKFIGGVLVTGGVGVSDQQRLQESARDAVQRAVLEAISEIPGLPRITGECLNQEKMQVGG